MPGNRSILPRSKWWWLGLAILLVLAGWLYLRGYNVSLPYMLPTAEPQYLLGAQHVIDDGTARAVYHDAYPPGITAVGYVALRFLNPPDAHHGAMLPFLRLVTVSCWLLSIALVALLAARLSSEWAGLAAAAIWLANPWVADRARFFMPDGYLTMFTIMSFWLAVVGMRRGRPRFLSASLYIIMLASVFKTQAIFAAPIIALCPLAGLREAGHDKRQVRLQLIDNFIRLSLFSCWYLFLTPILIVDRTNDAFPMAFSEFALPSPQILLFHLTEVGDAVLPTSRWPIILIFGCLMLRYRRRFDWPGLSFVLLASFSILLGASLFGRQELRQFYPLGAVLATLFAVGLTSVACLLQEMLQSPPFVRARPLFRRFGSSLPAAAILTMLAINLLPDYRKSDAIANDFSRHDRRNDLAVYMDTSPAAGRLRFHLRQPQSFQPRLGRLHRRARLSTGEHGAELVGRVA